MASGEIIVNNLPTNTSPTIDDKVMVIRNADGELTNVTLDDIGDLIGGTPDVYWATYGTTTSAQIEAAYQAGQLCGVEYNNRIYFLEYRTSATKHGFRVVDVVSQAGTIFSINCTSDVWSTSSVTLAKSSDIPSASSATPQALGTAAAGSSGDFSRADHVHEMPDAEDVGAATPEDVYAAYPTDTASGSVASFSDGADDVPVKSLAVNIEPVQSGSGDPAPDNVRPITGHSGVTVWDDAYYGGLINWNQKAPALNTTNWKKLNTTGMTFTAADGVATVTIAGDKSVNTHIYPDPTPDVAGHVVYFRVDAKCDNAKSDQKVRIYFFQNASTGQSAIYTAVSANWETYEAVATITVTAQQIRFYVTTGSNSDFSYYIKNPQIIDLTQMFGAGNEPTTLDAFHALFPVNEYAYNAGTETTVGAVRNDPGWSVPVTFPTPPGTVYGGTLDVLTGVLTVDKAYWKAAGKTPTSSLSIGTNGSVATFSIDTNAAAVSSSSQSISAVTSVGYAQAGYYYNTTASRWDGLTTAQNKGGGFSFTQSRGAINIYIVGALTQAAYDTAVADFEVAYAITPITYQLTANEVSTLLGENNIWADTGNVSLEYRANPTLYIDKKVSAAEQVMELIITANRESEMKATKAYVSGDLIIVGGKLYKAIASIANGATLTVGTNISQTTVAAEIAAVS